MKNQKGKISRRHFMATAAVSITSAVTAPKLIFAAQKERQNQSRPNFLWISCEDISPHLGCYGWPDAITPNLDRLACQGTRFENAFSHSGVCAPTRSGIITGVYPTTLGTHNMRCKAALPENIKCFTEYLRRAGYYCTNNSKEDYQFDTPATAWDESSKTAHWRNRPKGKPFFAVRNFITTHEGRVRSAERHRKLTTRLTPNQRQDPKKLTPPPYYPDTLVTRRDWANYYELITAMDYQAGDILKQLEKDGLADDTIVFFWSDHGAGLPRAKRWLYDSGTHVPLIVRIPEKFRAGGQGKAGSVDDRLIGLIDLAPTMLNLAGIEIPDYMQGKPFLGPNLPAERKYVFGARDRMDERYDIIRTVRDKRYRYIRNYEPFKPYYQCIEFEQRGNTIKKIRRLGAKFELPLEAEIFTDLSKPTEEFYDLQNDRYELNNIAGSCNHQLIERFRREHYNWMLKTKDLGLIPEAELAELVKKYGSEYAILERLGGEKFLQKLIRIASLAGQPNYEDREKLADALENGEPVVRYWAAIGLGNLAGQAKPVSDLIIKHLTDKSASVRIACARALCMMGMTEKALTTLKKELKNSNQWVRLQAILVLDNIGEKAKPLLKDIKKSVEDKENKYVGRVAKHTLLNIGE